MRFIPGKDLINMVFLDSNIWLYSLLAQQSAEKSSVSRDLIQANREQIAISSQVVIEVAANLLRKGKFDEPEIAKYIEITYADHRVIDVSQEILLSASNLRERYSLSYFDSMIVAAALKTNSTILYSEDMQDGLVINEQLTIVNPFVYR
jgi:predicted nucleic acid-binding protein